MIMADDQKQFKPKKLTADEADKARKFILGLIEQNNSQTQKSNEKPKQEIKNIEAVKKVIQPAAELILEPAKVQVVSAKKEKVGMIKEEKIEKPDKNKSAKEVEDTKTRSNAPADYAAETRSDEMKNMEEKQIKVIEERIAAIKGVERELKVRDEVLEHDKDSLEMLKTKLEKLQIERDLKRKRKREVKISDLILIIILAIAIIFGLVFLKRII